MNYFQDSEFLNFPAAPSALQRFLLEKLRDNLNLVRFALGATMTISDCFRDMKKYQDMIARGYNPSAKSDHFWAEPVPMTSPADRARWGNFYIFSVGAVDIVPSMDVYQAFQKIVKMVRAGQVSFGQVIYECSAAGKKWVHLSNPRTLLFRPETLETLGVAKNPFLVSYDGGKNYRPYLTEQS